jgi:hypothetical protein
MSKPFCVFDAMHNAIAALQLSDLVRFAKRIDIDQKGRNVALHTSSEQLPPTPGTRGCVAPCGQKSSLLILFSQKKEGRPVLGRPFAMFFNPDRWWFAPLLYAGTAVLIGALVLA